MRSPESLSSAKLSFGVSVRVWVQGDLTIITVDRFLSTHRAVLVSNGIFLLSMDVSIFGLTCNMVLIIVPGETVHIAGPERL